MHKIIVVTVVIHLTGAALLLLMLANGSVQDADQWPTVRSQMVGHITLLTIGAIVGLAASTILPSQTRGRQRTSMGFLLASALTVVSIPLGWEYWLEMGSNVAFIVMLTLLVLFSAVYLGAGAISVHISKHGLEGEG